MKSSRVGLLFIFITCAALWIAARTPSEFSMDGVEPELAGIEKLHREDIAATLKSDPDQLAALWATDGVLLGQGERPTIGRQALREAYAKDGTRVLRYNPHIQDIQIS
jgi:hypothetical protein